MMLHSPLTFFCTLRAAVAGGGMLGVLYHSTKQQGQGLGVPQHLNWGASPSALSSVHSPQTPHSSPAHICQAAQNYPAKAVHPFISSAQRHPRSTALLNRARGSHSHPAPGREALAASPGAISNPRSERKQKPVFSL